MSEKPLGLAVIGAGIFAREAHLPAIAALSESHLVNLRAVYSRSQSSASNFAELAKRTLDTSSQIGVYSDDDSGLDDLLARNDIHAVIIALPILQQPEVIGRALKAGKHVLSEKPIAKDVQSALDLIKTYESEYKHKGIIWRIAENYECEPGIVAAADAVRSGKIGKVAHFKLSDSNYLDQGNKYYQTSWRTVPEYQGGFLLDGGVHLVALLRTILPDPIVSVTGHASLTKAYLAPHDTIQSILQTSSGAHGIFDVSFASPNKQHASSQIVITGSSGCIQISNTNKVPDRGGSDPRPRYMVKVVGQDGESEVSEFPSSGVEREIEYFSKTVMSVKDDAVVEGKGEPRGALRDVAVIQASLMSLGQLVNIAELVEGM
ncbi:hypothetical protein FRB96_009142 [Tulasnella sp. 330]|nr:hypothetical protein FRB96_009142 [Tulasnella sp. 330]KAG8877897.1 hypothetical protein FRB97_002931 [Tulasnella sp. 331]KAG8886893.1 hypothetical protein FRB98_000809 [Tulasnella sp. 332]